MSPEYLTLDKINQSEKTQFSLTPFTGCVHRVAKFLKTRMVGTGGWAGRKEKEKVLINHRASHLQDEEALEMLHNLMC